MRDQFRRTSWIMAAAGLALAPIAPTWAQPATATEPKAEAPAVSAEPDYVRTVTNEETMVSTLEVAIRSFEIKDPAGNTRTIHLVGAVHVADKSFYDEVQAFLDKQDLVLFEGVRPPGAGNFDDNSDDTDKGAATKRRMEFLLSAMDRFRGEHKVYPESFQELGDKSPGRMAQMLPSLRTDAWGHEIALTRVEATEGEGEAAKKTEQLLLVSPGPDGQASTEADNIKVQSEAHALGKVTKGKKDAPNIQQQLADALGLTFQMKGIDYSRKNFRPSDLSMDQIQDRIALAGGNADMLFSMLDGNSLTGKLVGVLMGLIKSSPSMSGMVKIIIVDMLGEAEAMASGMNLPGMEGMGAAMKVILGDRNQVVIEDIKHVLADEPEMKSVAAFYGAAHLAPMEKDLIAMGAKLTGERWIVGITADPEKMGLSKAEVGMARRMIKSQMAAMKKMQKKGD